MDAERFQQLWDEILSLPDVTTLSITAYRGDEPAEGEFWNISFLPSADGIIEQMEETLAWLKANPFTPSTEPKKRGRKKKV